MMIIRDPSLHLDRDCFFNPTFKNSDVFKNSDTKQKRGGKSHITIKINNLNN